MGPLGPIPKPTLKLIQIGLTDTNPNPTRFFLLLGVDSVSISSVEAPNQPICSTLSPEIPHLPSSSPSKFPNRPHLPWLDTEVRLRWTLQSLPPLSTLSTSVASALNAKLGTNEDLTHAPSIVAEFLTQCDDLERNLLHLNSTLESSSHLTLPFPIASATS
ncbi:hypothetical protein F3Y22_tig00112107pilonHSYRG00024 [Hibiscus syriacus]|uniref:Uncharacterized protein n=1 Tax=Hibiscus syriacus TaxID=106335 RepID=A0A6A2X6K3_HIBSY|nr:hypothetical protein F3Y22_tig00112107pilonHSYRG00024 [Hibiscus syriacus]